MQIKYTYHSLLMSFQDKLFKFYEDRNDDKAFKALTKFQYHMNRAKSKSFGPDDVEYTLKSGVELNRANPESFFIPDESDKKNLSVGDHVKLIFDYNDVNIPGERMWVEITEEYYPGFSGVLRNDPLFGWTLEFGDTILFNADNVIETISADFIVDRTRRS